MNSQQAERLCAIAATAVPMVAGMSLMLMAIGLLQKNINQRVIDTCPINIASVVIEKTAVGDTYFCVPRRQMYGPPVPLKD